jgi:hypothetical protein
LLQLKHNKKYAIIEVIMFALHSNTKHEQTVLRYLTTLIKQRPKQASRR